MGAVRARRPVQMLLGAGIAAAIGATSAAATAAPAGKHSITRAAALARCASTNLYQLPPDVLIACGYEVSPRVREVRLPDGGVQHVYNIDGTEGWTVTPPPGFDPATATIAQLVEYQFPTADEVGQTTFDSIVRNWMGRVPASPFLIGLPGRSGSLHTSPLHK